MEKYKIPYMSIDHLKMGLYRARGGKKCGFTPESKDEIITKKLWPIIKEIIKTNIENNQSIIIEGVNLPYSINDLGKEYEQKTIFFKICFSQEYIKNNMKKKIIRNENIIENRGYDFEYSTEDFIAVNTEIKNICKENKIKFFEIKKIYKNEIEEIYEWVEEKIKK